jgi:hypothetical protein
MFFKFNCKYVCRIESVRGAVSISKHKQANFTSKNKVKSVYYICFNFAARGKVVANSFIHLHFCKDVGKYEVNIVCCKDEFATVANLVN